jgi:Sec-independent protein secretion pathway component TatC
MEPFNIVIQMCVMGGLILATPFILFFIAGFVAPALTEKEMKAVIPVCMSGVALFTAGACFAFFLLIPNTLKISSRDQPDAALQHDLDARQLLQPAHVAGDWRRRSV